ncbi:hypothetical protein HPB51_001955 [Rhipicephalus microplus]|uniref:Uncharacterized protein n=1 Tax=Rhipicephalus microplus TaxID=6941 RepID=A0A9J6DXV2_RHIMP|nr:hypothetical protein HPB51_001955 [Rhipicephalus microplus]
MATTPCSVDVFEQLEDATRVEAYRSAVSEADILRTEVAYVWSELEELKHDSPIPHAAIDDDAPKPPLDSQMKASYDPLCMLLAPLVERIERLELKRMKILTPNQALVQKRAVRRGISNAARESNKDKQEAILPYACLTLETLAIVFRVSGTSGHQLQNLGQVSAVVIVNALTLQHDFVVVPQLPHEGILQGEDFFLASRAVVDWGWESFAVSDP